MRGKYEGMTPESTGQQDVRTILRILWRWKFLLLTFLVLVPLGAFLIEREKAKVYQSSVLIAPDTNSVSTGSTSPPAGVVPTDNLLAIAQLVTTTPVASAAAAFLHFPATTGFLLGEVTTSPNTDTGFLTITAQDANPKHAAAIANAFASALSNHQSAQAIQSIDVQIRAFRKQLARTPISDAYAAGTLSQQIATLEALRSSAGPGAQVIQAAVAPDTPAGPDTRRAVEIAFLIALLLGVGAVLIAENGDRRLRTPEALESLTNMPLLGTVAPSAFSPDTSDSPRDEESFQMLRASLAYFNVDRPLVSVAIVSPGPQDGKTTVAVGLAVAAARAGKRVVLVDADLRRPEICARLGINPAIGLGAVLAGEHQLSDVLIDHPVEASDGGRLLVLPAGPPPPNPSALLSSQEMRALLRNLEEQADLVIIDTPAALAVGDALPLLQSVSGVVVIVRMNHSSRAAVGRLQKVIASASGTVVGAVATASGAGAGYGEAYGYYYGKGGDRSGPASLLRRRRRRATTAKRPATPNGAAVSKSQTTTLAPLVSQTPASNGDVAVESEPSTSPLEAPSPPASENHPRQD